MGQDPHWNRSGVNLGLCACAVTTGLCPSRFNDEVKHIKVVEKDNWIHITEAKKFESLLVRVPVTPAAPTPGHGGRNASPLHSRSAPDGPFSLPREGAILTSVGQNLGELGQVPWGSWKNVVPELGHSKAFPRSRDRAETKAQGGFSPNRRL